MFATYDDTVRGLLVMAVLSVVVMVGAAAPADDDDDDPNRLHATIEAPLLTV